MDRNTVRAHRHLPVTVIAAAAIASCGGSSAPERLTDPATFAERYCALFAPCCADVGVTQGGSCVTVVGNTAQLVGKVSQLGETCLTDLKAKFDGFGFCNFSESLVASCEQVLGQVESTAHGTIVAGGPCTNTESCAPGTRGAVTCTFDLSTNALALRCQEAIPGKRGDAPCFGTLYESGILVGSSGSAFVPSGFTCAVADGLFCDSTGACAPRLQTGEPCNDAEISACASNYCASNVCHARSAIGQTCAGQSICVDNATCDTTTSTCVAKKGLGAACTSFDECILNSCESGVCTRPWNASSLGYLCAS